MNGALPSNTAPNFCPIMCGTAAPYSVKRELAGIVYCWRVP